MHNKVHIACNALLARDNPHCRRAERVTQVTFAILARLPRAFRQSLSSALEHFTAMAADTLLHYPDELCLIVPPEVAQMWLWHAAEETEHKAVCLDVHRAVLGSGLPAYLNRVFGMLFATPLFLFVLLAITAVVLAGGQRKKPVEQAAAAEAQSAAVFEAQPAEIPPTESPVQSDANRFVGRSMLGLLSELVPWRLYFSYYCPSLHPWDYDNSRFVAEWKQCYPGFGLG